MDTKEIFSKFSSRDYNNQLEEILENKDFSEGVKNLLLSMLYRIEDAYKDYATVKRVVEDKKNYVQEILEIIKDKCKKIIIAKEGTKEAEELQSSKSKFLVDKLEGKIYLMYPNEILLLYTIYKLNDKQIYLDEKYNLIRIALSELLNDGENINNIEVLRDFNGWNWNAINNEIPEITTNLIYQNLIYLLGIDFIKDWIHTEEVVDYVELVEKSLSKNYGKKYSKEILKQIYKISIIICVNKNERERNRLLEEKADLESELSRLDNKKELLNEISNSKKEAFKKIKEIDNILNDKKMLEEEYINRNQKRAQYNKIFNISHLTEILNKERKKLLLSIEQNNKLLEPKYYLKTKENIQNQLELLKDIELDEEEQKVKKLEYTILLQKNFIKCFNVKIQSTNEKEQIINLIYMLRYYNLLFINEKEQIFNIKELKQELEELMQVIIKKAYEFKTISVITNEKNTNDEIIKNILTTKIISLENIGIELKENGSNLEVLIYDGDVYEKTIIIPVYDKQKVVMKFGKIQKIFG